MSEPAAWIDITAHDAERSRSFYGDLFGWLFDVIDQMNYALFTAGPENLPGGIGQVGAGPHPAGIVTYFVVDDVETTLARARRLGGTVVVPPWTIAGMGTMAVVLDPEGNRVGLWTPVSQKSGSPA